MDWKRKMNDVMKQVGYVKLILLAVCAVFLIVVSLPDTKDTEMELGSRGENLETNASMDENDIYVDKMEKRLAEILELIDGAGKVEVMITLSSSSETVINKDESNEISYEKEDGESQRENQNSSWKEETVMVDEDGNQKPYVVKTMEPIVEGVIVVMEGGDNPVVNSAITEAVQALFHVEAHKIKVLKMEDGS